MSGRAFVPRRARGKGINGFLIVLLVLLGLALQSQWMDRAKKKGSTDIVPQGFAERLSNWMMYKKGLVPEGDVVSGGAEKVVCGTCMGGGTVMSGAGAKEMCPICQGVGFRMVRRLDPADRLCPFCGGMGRVEIPDAGKVGTCPRCDGRGLVRRAAPADAAPAGN